MLRALRRAEAVAASMKNEPAGAVGARHRQMSEPPLRAAIIPVTPLQQNCTLLWCTATMRGAFVDPGGDLPRLKAAAQQAGVTIEKILLTHGHIDHCGGAGDLGAKSSAFRSRARTKMTVSGSSGSRRTERNTALSASPFEPARWLNDGDQVTRRRAHLRRPPLPRPHARTRRLPPSGIETRARRRRPVPGSVGRWDFDRGDQQQLIGSITPAAMADGRRDGVRARSRADVHLRP